MNKIKIFKYFFILSLLLFPVFFININYLVNFAHDDSFYYLKIADNFSKGNYFTFDGVNKTNGFHPLWLVILSFIFFIFNKIFNTNPELLFRITFFIHLLISLLSVFVLYKINQRLKLNNIIIFLAQVFLLSGFVFIRDVGMETILTCFLFILLFYIKVDELDSGKLLWKYKIVIYSLLILTRNDYIFPIVLFTLIGDFLSSDKKYLINYIYIFFLIILINLLIVLFNYFYFGNSQIISAKILNGFPNVNLISNIQNLISPYQFLNQLFKLIIFIGGLIVFVIYYFRNNKTNRIFIFMFFALIGSFFYIFIHLMFNVNGLREWYMSFPIFVLITSLSLLFRKLNKKFLIFFASLSLCFFIIIFYQTRIKVLKYNNFLEFAELLKNNILSEEKVFSFDWMGIIGFFSERKVICGDGFVNSFEYLTYLRENKLNNYFNKYKINYYLTYFLNKEIKETEWIYDKRNTIAFNVDSLVFHKNKIILTYPYIYKHSGNNTYGKWYLFKMNNSK